MTNRNGFDIIDIIGEKDEKIKQTEKKLDRKNGRKQPKLQIVSIQSLCDVCFDGVIANCRFGWVAIFVDVSFQRGDYVANRNCGNGVVGNFTPC